MFQARLKLVDRKTDLNQHASQPFTEGHKNVFRMIILVNSVLKATTDGYLQNQVIEYC